MPATDSFFRNLPKTHAVFALNSILLLLATLWMLHDDHNDEWRAWQQKWDRIEDVRLAGIGLDQQDTLDSEAKRLDTQIAERNAFLEGIEPQLAELETELAARQQVAATRLRATKPLRTFRDVARANYDLAVRDMDPNAGDKLTTFNEKKAIVDAAEREL
ncbi:MAG: hypothetical protein VX669_07290, partial [Planctomycetota bacterium]|nr:hypothetical protein [Planctomycetota bacterium]